MHASNLVAVVYGMSTCDLSGFFFLELAVVTHFFQVEC